MFLHSGSLPGSPSSDGPHCPAPWSLAGSAAPVFCSLLSHALCFSLLAPCSSLLLPAAYNPDQISLLKQTSDLRLLPVFLPQKSSSSHSSLNTLLGPPSFAQFLLTCSFTPCTWFELFQLLTPWALFSAASSLLLFKFFENKLYLFDLFLEFLVPKNSFAGQQWRNRHREQIYGHGGEGKRGRDIWRE